MAKQKASLDIYVAGYRCYPVGLGLFRRSGFDIYCSFLKSCRVVFFEESLTAVEFLRISKGSTLKSPCIIKIEH